MLRLAVQKSGRLTRGALDLLKRGGFEFEEKSTGLINPCKNFPLELLLLRDEDIPEAVSAGAADLGIVGSNVLEDYELRGPAERAERLLSLPFSSCRLSLAVPTKCGFEVLTDLKGKRIATSYPSILAHFSEAHDLSLLPVLLNGSVEVAPALGLSDGIFDLVSTGETLKQNNLREFYKVLECNPLLISRPLGRGAKAGLRDALISRLNSAINSQTNRYLVFNAPKSNLDSILRDLPSIDGPTLMELANDFSKVAIHTVVKKDQLWKTISAIQALGATGVLSFSMEAQIN